MAQPAQTEFGDRETSDVILRLIYPAGAEYHGNPLFLHSHTLKKSDFFGAMISERWSSEVRPLELTVGVRHENVDHYLKFFQIMYLSERERLHCFANVKEAIGVLEIAWEFLFNDCVEVCMQYLEAVRWTYEENLQIRGLISAAQMQPLPELAARLGISERMHGSEIGRTSGTLMSLISTDERVRDITARLLLANLKDYASPALSDAMAAALVGGLQSNLEVIKSEYPARANSRRFRTSCSALLWLVQNLQSWGMLESAVKFLAEGHHDLIRAMARHPNCDNSFTPTLFEILIILVNALGSGKVICSKSVRLSLITTWWPVIENLYYSQVGDTQRPLENLHTKLVEELIGVAQTLPLADRAQIVNVWIEAFLKVNTPLNRDLANFRVNTPLNRDLANAVDLLCNELRQVLLG